MLKKFIDGLIFGTGFGIAFVAILLASVFFMLPTVAKKSFKSMATNSQDTIVNVPAIEAPQNRYLGSTNITSSGFTRKGILNSGNGKIIGSAKANGKPIKGLTGKTIPVRQPILSKIMRNLIHILGRVTTYLNGLIDQNFQGRVLT